MVNKNKITIKIPKELYTNLQDLVNNTGFSSVTDFITFTMRSVASGKTLEKEGLDKGEVDKVRQRLKALGYL